MFCGQCGKQLPDDANFCLKCGQPQRASVQAVEPRWEMCEIRFDSKQKGFFNTIDWFWAQAVGPKGSYNAGESEPVLSSSANIKKRDDALHKLIQRLTSEGWEPISRGIEYYAYRFRRRVTFK